MNECPMYVFIIVTNTERYNRATCVENLAAVEPTRLRKTIPKYSLVQRYSLAR